MTTKLASNQIDGNSINVKDYGATGDGVTDDRVAITAAIADLTSNSTLLIPDGIFVISKAPSQVYGINIDALDGVTVTGGGTIKNNTVDSQVVKITTCTNFVWDGVNILGPNSNGVDTGDAQLQGNNCTEIRVQNCEISDADADGISLATCTSVHIDNVYSTNCAKAAIYTPQSARVSITNCRVTGFGGYTASGNIVGGGILCSSVDGAVVTGNHVWSGTGQGIILNAISLDDQPKEYTVSNNVVYNVANATNTTVSSGIFVTNQNVAAADNPEVFASKVAGMVISGNVVRACGVANYEIKNLNAVKVHGNISIESVEDGFIFSYLGDSDIYDNTAYNTNTSNGSTKYAYTYVNSCRNIRGRRNIAQAISGFATSYGSHTTNDSTSNDLDVIEQGRTKVITGDTTLTVSDFDIDGKLAITNSGAAGTVTVTLPSADSTVRNFELELVRVTGQLFRLDVASGEQFRGESVDKYLELQSNGAVLKVKSFTSNIWERVIEVGTVAVEP